MTGLECLISPAGTVPTTGLVHDGELRRYADEGHGRPVRAAHPRRYLTTCLCALGLGVGLLTSIATPVDARQEDRATRIARQASIKKSIVEEALEQGVSPALALAIAHAESQFRPWVKSRKGARGVMQLLPSTAEGEFGVHPKHLWDADKNVETGIKFLKQLLKRYGDEKSALSHYNGGRSTNPREQAQIWRVTRPYVVKVQGLKKTYQGHIDRLGLAYYLGRSQPNTRIADDDARAGRNEVLIVHLPPVRPDADTVVVDAGGKKSFSMPLPRPGTRGLRDYDPVSVAFLP